MELAFEVIGAGPPVIVLHGLFASAASWRGVARELGERHRVFSVDLRNHGSSPRASDMSYMAMADDVLRLIEQERLDRPALIGHSMGGKVAMALALTAPQAVGAVAVVDIAPVTFAAPWVQQLQLMSDLLVRDKAPRTSAGSCGNGGNAGAANDGMLAWLMAPRLATRNAYVDWRSNLPAIGLSIHELCGFPRQLRYLSSDVPLRAIVGARSDCVHPATPEVFAPMFPRASVEAIAGAGHWVHADQPAALVASLRRMLAAKGTAPGAAGGPRRPYSETRSNLGPRQ